MTWEAWATLVTIALLLYGLARKLAAPDVLLMGGLTLLTTLSIWSDRLPSPGQVAAAFGNEGLLTVGVLFVVAAGLTETGGIQLVGERLLGRPRSVVEAQTRLMVPVAIASAFLNNTPIVAMFLPAVTEWCKRTGISPSKLLLPLSYAAVLGGLCTLVGTSTTLVVQGLLLDAQRTDPTVPTLRMFTIGAVGLPAALLGIGYLLLVSSRLLPERKSPRAKLSDAREYTVAMRVEPGGAVDSQTIQQAGLRHLPGMYLAAIERNGDTLVAVGPEQVLRGNDQLIFVGVVESVVDLRRIRGLLSVGGHGVTLTEPRYSAGLVEAVVSPTCPLVGTTIRDGQFRTRYGAVVIAVHRNGERVHCKLGDIVLRAGDTLLLETDRRFLHTHRHSRDFFLVSAVPNSHAMRHDRGWLATSILAGMVLLVAFEDYTRVTIFQAALVAAALMGLTRCCSAEQARRSIDWSTLAAIGAALGIGHAIERSGLADQFARYMIAWCYPLGPWGVLAGVYVITLLFTEAVTNNAAAALAFPIARAAAAGLDVNLLPFAIAVAVGASAGFATPLGYQTHLMVYGPGGYRFKDYVTIGAPMDLLVMAVTIALTPLIFPFA